MTRDIYILGAGGHGRDVADVAAAVGLRPILVTDDANELATWSHPDPIVDEAAALAGIGRLYAVGIGDNRIRARVASRLAGRECPALIHPDTSFGRGSRDVASAARGSVIFPGARFTGNLLMGEFVTVNLGVTVSHDVELCDFANLSPGAHVAGNVRICEGAWLGVGVAVNQGAAGRKRQIGAWATVGSGAVVIADCDPNAVYVGVPARKIR